jgi:N-acetyl-gamma-glutamyl-phosphate reductase
MAPAFKKGLIDPTTLIADCKTGVSGAGLHLNKRMHYAECAENLNAYKVTGHKHVPEIDQELGLLCGSEVAITFVPHLLPATRGILSTLYTNLVKPMSVAEVQAVYEDFYRDEFFVRVLPVGEECTLKGIQGSNFCDLSIHVDERVQRLIITSTIDNLIKGASGQALQNMNIALGFDETEGLRSPGIWV